MSRAKLESELGTSVVERVHREWQVDGAGCEWSPRGFAWCGHRFRQRVWAEPGFEDQGVTVGDAVQIITGRLTACLQEL